jgi:hypothetical protein
MPRNPRYFIDKHRIGVECGSLGTACPAIIFPNKFKCFFCYKASVASVFGVASATQRFPTVS